jgi:hypothetical protein
MHGARLAVCLFVLLAVGLVAGCNFYDDDGVPVPSSSWTWMCDDGSLAPDAGCPDSGDADSGTSSGDGDDAGTSDGDDADSRQAR